MKNKKKAKISRNKEKEIERKKLKDASVIDEITIDVNNEEVKSNKESDKQEKEDTNKNKKEKNRFKSREEIKKEKQKRKQEKNSKVGKEKNKKEKNKKDSLDEVNKVNGISDSDFKDSKDISSKDVTNEKDGKSTDTVENNDKKTKDKKEKNATDKSKTDVRTKRKKKKNKKRKNTILLIILIILLVLIIRIAYKFIKGMNHNGWTIGGLVATMLGHDENTLANLSRINILLIGQSQNLTDTLLVCSYDPKTQDAVLLSIPRDTFVGKNKQSASAFNKINSIYQISPDNLLQAVRDITELDINYYVKVDTQGLRELVDSVGGIYFDVPIDMDYDDGSQDLYIHMKKGYQLLDGNKAEQVLRFRHNNDGSTYPSEYGEQDIGRMKTQRAFLTEVFKQLVQPKNIKDIDDYIRIANNNVETNFSIWNLKDYAPYLLDYKIENLKTATLPGQSEKINELWFYACNKKETKKLIAELFKTELTAEKEENAKIKVRILNGTSNENNLVNLKNLLQENGYTIESTGNTSLTRTTTILNRTNQEDAIADKLQKTIGVGIIANSTKEEDSKVDFTIIIGDDYI